MNHFKLLVLMALVSGNSVPKKPISVADQRGTNLADTLLHEAEFHEFFHRHRAANNKKKPNLSKKNLQYLEQSGWPLLPHDWNALLEKEFPKINTTPKAQPTCTANWPAQNRLSSRDVLGLLKKGANGISILSCHMSSIHAESKTAQKVANAVSTSAPIFMQLPSQYRTEASLAVGLAYLRKGNYPEALRSIFNIADQDRRHRQSYDLIQRAYAYFQKGGGSVALRTP